MKPRGQLVSTKSECFSKVRSKIIAMVEKGEIPSMAVAIAQEGKILWKEAFGWATLDNEVRATFNTIYPIASLSKSLTATGIMVLVEQKKVELDDPVEEYIAPSRLTVYEGKASEVTVRRVLNMTSGVPHGYMVYEDPFESPSLREFINRYGIAVFPPGELYLYSNFSYAILQLVIESVSGQSYSNFMKSKIFNPLGMTQTSVGLPNNMKYVATKYAADNTAVAHNHFAPAAAGGIYSSVHDLIRYGMFHLGNHLEDQEQILDDDTLTTMHTAKDENLPTAITALGWGSVTLDNNTVWILSNGGIEGATSMLSLVPSANLAVACLSNVTARSRITDKIAIEITNTLIPNFSKSVEAFMNQYESSSSFKTYVPIPTLTGSWEGKIIAQETDTPIKLFFHDNSKIHVKLGKQHERILKNAGVRSDEFKGDFQGISPIENELHSEHTISIHVRVKKNRMYGVATAELNARKGLLSPSYVYLDKM